MFSFHSLCGSVSKTCFQRRSYTSVGWESSLSFMRRVKWDLQPPFLCSSILIPHMDGAYGITPTMNKKSLLEHHWYHTPLSSMFCYWTKSSWLFKQWSMAYNANVTIGGQTVSTTQLHNSSEQLTRQFETWCLHYVLTTWFSTITRWFVGWTKIPI